MHDDDDGKFTIKFEGWRLAVLIVVVLWCLFGGMRMLVQLLLWLGGHPS